MADYSKTCLNTIDALGYGDNWGDYNWNAFVWGDGTASLEILVTKVVDSSITPDTDTVKTFSHVIDETLSITEDMNSETLQDSEGYYYVFPGNATNIENRVSSTYTSGTAGSTTWTSGTASSTSWS